MTVKLPLPPNAPRADLIETLHGTPVADPFRPLETDSAETQAWVDAQDARTRAALDAMPRRDSTKDLLRDLWDYPKMGVPFRRGERCFYFFQNGTEAQFSFGWQQGLDGEGRVLIDPNTLSEDGTIALSGATVSPDGSRVVYGLSEAGSDAQKLRIRDVETGRDSDEVLAWCKFTSTAWLPGGKSFLYNRCPTPDEVPNGEWDRYSRLCLHRVGTPQDADEVLLDNISEPDLRYRPFEFRGTPYVGLYVSLGTDPKYGLRVARADGGLDWLTIAEPGEVRLSPVGITATAQGDALFALTDLHAPNYRLVEIPLSMPARQNWRTVVPESGDVLEYGTLAGGKAIISRLRDAAPRLIAHDLQTGAEEEIELPPGSSHGFADGGPDDPDIFVQVTGFTLPSTIYRYDFADRRLELFRESAFHEPPRDWVVKQAFATSADGTRVPMWIVHRHDAEWTGDAPTLLTGYGGFGASVTPYFALNRLPWIRDGGVLAVANLRGGGEYGARWHDAARHHNKQRTFDDFIACAEWLVENRVTRPQRLAIQGGSNGGLLVAACMLQRPDLFGAVVCAVPVTDMLRFHRFTIGAAWTSDYGSPEDPDDFKALLKYSPLHNVEYGTEYPPILITTGDHDDRVAPVHAFKFAAALQETADPGNVVLLRVDRRVGHGAGMATEKLIEVFADVHAFLAGALAMEVKQPDTGGDTEANTSFAPDGESDRMVLAAAPCAARPARSS